MEIDDDGNEIASTEAGPEAKSLPVKKRPARFSQSKKAGGRPRMVTDVNSEEMQNVFKSLKKVSSNPNPFSIAELICNVVTADLHNKIPGEVVTRTQKSIETLNGISEDMIYAGGNVGIDNDMPMGLEADSNIDNNVLQLESKNIIDKIKNKLPEEEILLESNSLGN